MKLNLKKTPEQVELIKAIGSKDPAVSRPALEAFAAFIAPVAQKVLSVAGFASMVYRDVEYNEDDPQSIPLDLYLGATEGNIPVWSQSIAGGIPRSEVTGTQELKFASYNLSSAVSWLKKYARKARLDVINAATKRMIEEILVKQERNAWAVIVKALAEASTNTLTHVINSTTADVFQVDDLNRLMTRIDRINTAWGSYSPSNFDAAGVTDLFVSPEVMEQVRSFAYQPMNTRAYPNTDESTSTPLPDSVREEIYRNPNVSSIYDVALHKMLELGDGKKYNTLFDSFYGGTFAGATDQIVIGIDNSRDAFLRPVEVSQNSQITILPDDQFVSRADKAGLYADLNEGRICIEARATVGIRV